MLDPKFVRANPEAVAELLKKKGFEFPVERFIELDNQRKAIQTETEALQNERNTRSKSIGKAKASGEDIQPLLDEVQSLGQQLDDAKQRLNQVQATLDALLLGVPNIPHESVPAGADEEDNVEVRRWGTPAEFSFEPQDPCCAGRKKQRAGL